MGNTRLPLKFSQEIRAETRISHLNLKGDLVGKIYLWGIFGGWGMCSALYTVKCTVGGDIWRGYVPHYILEGGYVLHYIRYTVKSR